MAFIKTGVNGLDEILKGGFKEKSSILVSGTPGTGKTIFCLQFLFRGLIDNEPCLFICSEETKESIYKLSESINFNLKKYEKNFHVLEKDNLDFKIKPFGDIYLHIKKKKIKRVVLDSITLLKYSYSNDPFEFRKGIFDFLNKLKSLDVIFVATNQKSRGELDSYLYDDEDFLFEGLIILAKVRRGSSFERVLTIPKMRGQDYLIDIYPFTIDREGIKIFKDQFPFSLTEKKSN